MIKQERISRYERRRNFAPLKFFLISALSLALVGLVAYKITRPKTTQIRPANIAEPKPQVDIGVVGDSVIKECCRSFFLSEAVYLESSRSQAAGVGGALYHRFYQDWPQEIPPIEFARRLNTMASIAGLDCDSQESSKGKWVECILKLGTRVAAGIHVQAGDKANLAGRDLTFILNNFGALKGEEVTNLIKSGLTFSYITSPDIFPTSDMRKLMARANITPILRLPSTPNGWISLGQNMGLGKKSGKKKVTFDSELIDNVLARQADTKVFCFDLASGIDKEVVSQVLARAGRKKMSYFCGLSNSGRADSLAMAVDIRALEISGGEAIWAESVADLKFKLFNNLLAPDSASQRLAVYPDVAHINIESLVQLRVTLIRLGVRIRPLMKIATPIERL